MKVPKGLARAALAALAYFASARLGYALEIPHGIVILWPPAGVMLGLLLVSNRKDWPALLAGGVAGSFASDRLQGYSVGLASFAAIANVFESFAAGWFLTREFVPPVTLSSLRKVLRFVVGAAVLTNLATAIVGAVVLHRGFGVPFSRAWMTWWIGDGLGMLIVTPVILAAFSALTRLRRFNAILAIEAGVMVSLIAVVAQVALGPGHHLIGVPGSYVVFPLLFWASLRFGPGGAAAAVLIVAAIAMGNAALGAGPFVNTGSSAVDAALQMYTYLGVASISSLLPAAVVEERKAAAERLLESEARHRQLFESNPHPMWVYDVETHRFLAVNDAAVRRYGYTAAEFLRMHIEDIRPPEQLPRLHKHIARLGGASVDHEVWRHRAKDGSEMDVEVSSQSLNFGGRPARLVHGHDLTERRRAEESVRSTQERLQRVIASSGAVILEIEFSGSGPRLAWISENVTRILGYEIEDTRTPDWWATNIHPDDRARVPGRPRGDAYADGSSEYRFRHKNGQYRWLRDERRLVRDRAGQPAELVIAWLDITDWRKLQEQFQQSQKMEAIGTLAGGVAHDFNNILTVIIADADYALSGESDFPGRREALGEILTAADRAARLTRQLLMFSRRQLVEPALINLNELVSGLESMLRRLIGENIQVRLKLEPALGTTLADRGQIEQVFVNLAVNARDAMSDGGTLTIETANARLDQAYLESHPGVVAGDYVVLVVNDTGTGMSEAVRARLFEPFFTTKERGKGTGLGLATSYGIAQRFGGHIAVYSEPGVGTTMSLYLPRAEAEGAPSPEPEAARVIGGNETVLLVEDDEQVRRVSARMLRSLGYVVHEAASGEEAIELLAERPGRLDLVFTDVVLPKMGGRELAEHVARLRPETRVLFASGYSDDALIQHQLLGKDIVLLQKPFTSESLAAKVREALQR